MDKRISTLVDVDNCETTLTLRLPCMLVLYVEEGRLLCLTLMRPYVRLVLMSAYHTHFHMIKTRIFLDSRHNCLYFSAVLGILCCDAQVNKF